jgi:putative nucleotidyltransferase with HDIG domain
MTTTADVQELVTNSCTLPPMPVVATRVMRELMNPEATADSLSKIIETDQALVTRILKIANSAFYGCARKVGSIQLAVVVLGFNTLKNLVIATSTKSLYQQQGPAEQMLWEHSLAVGVASHVLAMAFCPAHLEDAFTAGLLHDLGKLILYTQEPERYTTLLELQKRGVACHSSEQDAYGFTHADVGAVLANRWNLPVSFESAIGLHHSLDTPAFKKLRPDARELTALINLSNTITKQSLAPASEGVEVPTDGLEIAMETLAVARERVDEFLTMIKETLEAEKGLFEI